MSYALVAIAAYGFWYIVGRAKISQAPRDWLNRRLPFLVALVECPGCFGFWTGLALAAILPRVGVTLPGIALLCLPFAITGTNRLLHAIASFGDLNDHRNS